MIEPAASSSPDILHTITAQGPLVAVLVVAIVWLQKTMSMQASEAAAALRAANELFQKERDARLDAMDEHIRNLDARSQACETDRIKLWQMLARRPVPKEENAQDAHPSHS
jgi:hypothetical protein